MNRRRARVFASAAVQSSAHYVGQLKVNLMGRGEVVTTTRRVLADTGARTGGEMGYLRRNSQTVLRFHFALNLLLLAPIPCMRVRRT
jgi:hypothetical protein